MPWLTELILDKGVAKIFNIDNTMQYSLAIVMGLLRKRGGIAFFNC